MRGVHRCLIQCVRDWVNMVRFIAQVGAQFFYLLKAKFLLDWKPQIDLKQLIDKAWDFQRAADDPRKVWYPG